MPLLAPVITQYPETRLLFEITSSTPFSKRVIADESRRSFLKDSSLANK
ncbi:hypothetical protein ACFLTH_17765 [Bacteroidota bacterium]